MTEQQRNELKRQEQDAVRRMREMSSRSTEPQSDMPPMPDFIRINKGPARETVVGAINNNGRTGRPEHRQSRGAELLRMLNFKNLRIDPDVTVIITLMLLLSSEDCDELLLLALIYIML